MGAEQQSTFKWPQGAMMAEGLRLLTLKKGMEEGTEYSVKMFSSGVMQAVDAKISIGQSVSSGPVRVGNSLVVTSVDGTLYLVDELLNP